MPPRRPASKVSAEKPIAKNIDVQEITQADFDVMNPSRQDFIRGRVEAGQIKIVSPYEIEPSLPNNTINETQKQEPRRPLRPQNRAHTPSCINRYRNKLVRIQLTNCQTITGMLAEVWQYELVVHTNVNAGIVTILKHAVATIEEIEDDVSENTEPEPGQGHSQEPTEAPNEAEVAEL